MNDILKKVSALVLETIIVYASTTCDDKLRIDSFCMLLTGKPNRFSLAAILEPLIGLIRISKALMKWWSCAKDKLLNVLGKSETMEIMAKNSDC